ncbi:hypothetical protein [Paracoccus mutanolyticus]|uniref:hypothetical protein n=1 Tax=Paracoccus mutanolyticus TaxID=1499308 RepID=UPI001676AF1A|nr:hypothetical protein [Paracoccus mutanolyticus]
MAIDLRQLRHVLTLAQTLHFGALCGHTAYEGVRARQSGGAGLGGGRRTGGKDPGRPGNVRAVHPPQQPRTRAPPQTGCAIPAANVRAGVVFQAGE